MTFIDGRTISRGGSVKADVCVIGGGAAGISFATEFADTSAQVVLIEGGTAAPELDGRSVHQVIPAPTPTLGADPSKSWYLGGNTNYWYGNCRPLDECDFLAREWVPHSGWPIAREELVPYYHRAQRTAGLGSFEWYDVAACRPHLEHPALDFDGAVLETRIVQTCPVLSFADLHRERLERSGNVKILLGTHALRLRRSGQQDRVSAVEAVDRDGRRLVVQADQFVLAAGGVENARLLLCSGEPNRPGPGNEHDLVGRYFMEHWFFDIGLGEWKNGEDVELYENRARGRHEELEAVGDARVWAQLVLSEKLTEDERLPGLGLWFAPAPLGALGVSSARRLAKSLVGRERSERPVTDLRLALSDPGEVSRHLLRKLRSEDLSTAGHALRVQIEQTPDPENRIRLSSAKDRFGERIPQLDLRLRPDVRQDHLRSVQIAAAAIGLDGKRIAKQMRVLLDAGWFGFFWHHMGTTRMDADPTAGVVDADCRVHGTPNVFVAGSSVFPTGGSAAPTLTIVALALRLADHVRRLHEPTRARSEHWASDRPPSSEIPAADDNARTATDARTTRTSAGA